MLNEFGVDGRCFIIPAKFELGRWETGHSCVEVIAVHFKAPFSRDGTSSDLVMGKSVSQSLQ